MEFPNGTVSCKCNYHSTLTGFCMFQDGIVQQLQCRFQQNQIYTYIGDILVAVNPFIDLGLYTDVVSGFSGSCSAFSI